MKYIIILTFLLFASDGYCQTIYSLGDLTQSPADSFCYAVIGDYGNNSGAEDKVAKMVKSWQPLFIITTGDNDYEDKCDTCAGDDNHTCIDSNISKYYSSYIRPDIAANRFFPCLGNHDQPEREERSDVIKKYFELFSFLHNAKNYDFVWGPVHFYSINSGPGGKQGKIKDDVLADLKKKSVKDPEPFHIVLFHHPQYSSGLKANPVPDHFAGNNIDVVLNGHIHYYERMKDTVNNIQYITIGCSGREDSRCSEDSIYGPGITDCLCFDGHPPGAVRVTVVKQRLPEEKDKWRMTFEYYDVEHRAYRDVVTVAK